MENSFAGISKSELVVDRNVDSHDSGLLSREAYVLGAGLKDGLVQGAARSLNDLNEFGNSFAKDPAGAVVDLAKNHWSEATVAAALSFIAPRKIANTLIAAVSMRGVGEATYDSLVLAADSRNDLNKVKDHYTNSMASETHALVSSLPMTLAGGFAGKIGANAVFGKGFGAWDAATGERSLGDIKNNLWDLHDKLLPPKAQLVVFDLDGTLVSTNRHLSIGIDKGTQQIAQNTGLPAHEVRGALYDQFKKLGTFASSWTTELALEDKLSVGKPGGMSFDQFKTKVSDAYWKALDDAAPENLRLYDGVKPTFAELNAQNIPVVVFSNSAAEAVVPRIAVHGLSEYTSKILALKNVVVPNNLAPELFKQGADRQAARMSSPGAEQLVEVSRDTRKPNPTALQQLMKDADLRPKQVIMVGDSLKDDMGIANNSGARGFWVRYSEIDKQFDSVMDGISNHKDPTPILTHELELNSFSDILKNLRPARDLKGAAQAVSGLPSWHTPILSYGLLGHEK